MFKIENGKITMIRGDTLSTEVSIMKDGEAYTPQSGDSIKFAMKHQEMDVNKTRYLDDEPVLVKEIPYDTLVLKLNSEDTKGLDFGTYVYDVEITFANGDVDTFIQNKITLKPEVD